MTGDAAAKRFAATSPFEPPPMTTASTSAGSAMSAFHQSRVRHHSRPSYPASCMAEPLAVRKTPSSNLVPPKMIANGHVSGWSGPYMASRAVDIQGDRSMGCLGAGPSDTGIPPQRAGPSDTGIPPQRLGSEDRAPTCHGAPRSGDVTARLRSEEDVHRGKLDRLARSA